MEFFIITLFFLAIILAICKPSLGLYTFFIIAYIRPQDFSLTLAYLEPAKWILVATFLSFSLRKCFNGEKFVAARQNWAILGIAAFVLLSRINAVDPLKWSGATQDFIRVILVYFLFINLVNSPKRLKTIFVVLLLVNLFVALRFYISYKAGTAIYWGSKPGDFSYGFLANADDLGIGLVVALALALVTVFYSQNLIVKGLCVLMSGCFMLGVLATNSRGSLMGVFAVFIAVIISHMKPSKLKQSRYGIGMLIILLLFSAFIVKYRWTIQGSYESVLSEGDAGKIGRYSTWAAAKQMIKDSPIVGVGRNNFVSYWKMNYPAGVFGYQVAHNILYEVAAEIGLLGLVFFLYFSLYGLAELRKINKIYKYQLNKNYLFDMIFAVYMIGLVGFYTNGMFITVAFYWHIYILVALFVSARSVFLKEIADAKAT